GVGFNQATQRLGWRHNSARAYLGAARGRTNLSILTRTHVTKVLFSGTHASGVEYSEDGTLQRAQAGREVVVAAGSIGSPHLLMLSGIGPPDLLHKHYIEVVSESPSVGQNLQEHPCVWLTYQMRVPTLNSEKSLARQLVHGLNWFFFGKGPATTAGSQAVAFLRTSPAEPQPDVQLHFTPVGYKFLPSGVTLYDEPTVSVAPNVCRPKSRGHVTLRSSNASDPPVIDMPLLDNPDDVRVLIEGCRRAREVMGQSQIAPLVIAESAPGSEVTSAQAWERYLRQTAVPAYHPVGTCRMGNDAASVVDPELRVRGLTGLRVADASIMPRIVSGNTNAAAIMIGEKASDLIRGLVNTHEDEAVVPSARRNRA
ncbi:MAG: GMC family oxidoreductase, partial [Mycobacteriales bacterium]